jgi:IclR family pca regulon transcriptional regulator
MSQVVEIARSPRIRSVDRMGGLARGLDVIEAFGQDRERLTIADIARRTGLDRPAARRCLLTLLEKGYAATDGRYFSLAPRILRQAHAYLGASIPRLVQPTLEKLAALLGESCSSSMLDDVEIVYIARAMQRRVMSIGLSIGSRLPSYCTSMGRVLLAALPQEEARTPLLGSERTARTPHTLIDPAMLMLELERVRKAGYALIDQELEVGLRSIAVPVHNAAGRVVCAINVGAQATQATAERLVTAFLPHLLEAQAQLARILP